MKNAQLYFCLSLILFLAGCQPGGVGNRVCFKNKCFQVEVAATDEARVKGLQGRTALDKDAGMLFIFPQSRKHAFWMKDTLIPLDLVWLDLGRRIVHIEKNVQPCASDPCESYQPKADALYVLEIPATAAVKNGLEVGDVARFFLDEYLKENTDGR